MKAPFDQVASLAWSQFWQVTVLVLAVAVVVRLFCRRRPHLAYMLWLLVIVKCLTPPIWSSRAGVFSWATARATTSPAPESVENIAVRTPPPEEVPVIDEPPPRPELTPAAAPTESFAQPESSFQAPKPPVRAATVLGMIWLGGSLAYVATAIGTRLKWSWLLRDSSVAADGALVSLVADLSKRLGVRRKVRLRVTSRPLGPLAYGVFRPTLLLPELLWSEKSPRPVEPVLAHELIHVRRADNAVGILQLAAQAIWWFHPLVWWANREACREKERCCDEEAVARLGCEPGEYAQGLLDVLKLKQKLRPVFAFPGVRPGEITSKRMEEIMEPRRRFHRRTPRWCWALTLAAAALILPGRELLITQAAEPQKPDESVGRAAEPPKADEKTEVASATTKQAAMTLRQVAKWCSGVATNSPDGKYLCDVFYSGLDRNMGDLLIRDLTTGEKRRIATTASGKGPVRSARISPDSKSVAYLWHDRKKEAYELGLTRLDGSGHRTLCTGEYILPKRWSWDGERILGIRGRWWKEDDRAELVWVSTTDGSVQVLKTFGKYPWGMVDVSPDGRYMAYNPPQEEATSKGDIVVVALDDNREIPLVKNPADDRLLAWTPDGKYIFFASDRSGAWDAWLLRVADGEAQGWPQLVKRDIGNVTPKGFTRSGSYFCQRDYSLMDAYVAMLELETGKVISPPKPVRHMSISACPAWSPDGQYVAYCSWHPDGSSTIHVRSLKTGQDRELDPDLPKIKRLVWSPDGRSLLTSWLSPRGEFAARRGTEGWGRSVYQIDAKTGDSSLLLQTERVRISRAELSPDGKSLFYGRGASVVVRDLENGQDKEIFEFPPSSQEWITWDLSPDGKRLALGLSGHETGAQLKIISTTGGEPKKLFDRSGRTISNVAWTPDSQNVLFALAKDFQGTALWQISAEGAEPQKLLDSKFAWWYSLRVHPDGQRIAFHAGVMMHEMWVMENFLPPVDAVAESE